MTGTNQPIPLLVSNKKAYVWDVDNIAKLRSHYHICGMLTGTLPHLSQQNIFLGIPLLLMPEEVVLLVEKGFACLIDDQNAHQDPSPELLSKWDSARVKAVQHQLALAEEEQGARERYVNPAMSEEAIRKRRERERRKGGITSAANEHLLVPLEQSDHNSKGDQEISSAVSSSGVSGATYTVHVSASSSGLEWYNQPAYSFATLTSAREAGIWDYPTTADERARCAVFHDLWEKGYFMGGGIKFGGDYLVYPGDPLRYHSHFVASVITSPRTALQPMEIVAHGRLGTGTKKSHLLCEWDEEDNVTYYSIEWAGFG
ncbi:hypothetical protein V8B97DRAFT_1866172 [Scleroderma yunnanense]